MADKNKRYDVFMYDPETEETVLLSHRVLCDAGAATLKRVAESTHNTKGKKVYVVEVK